MRWQHLAGWLGPLVLPLGCVCQPRLDGPMPVRNQHPAQLTVLHMAPASATVLAAGDVATRADAAYSSLFLRGGTPLGNSFRMDGEYLRVAGHVGVGLGGGLQLDAELPVAHTSGGFLDSFLIGYHDLFGFPDQGRTATARDDFSIRATKDGSLAWSVEAESLAWLDVPLLLTWQLTDAEEAPLGVAVRGGVELPTGNARRGYGNGQLDSSLGVVLEHHAAGIGLYGHLQHTFAGNPDSARAVGLDFADVTSIGLAAELPLSEALHAFVQLEWETSTLRHLGIRETERDQFLLWLGGRLDLDAGWQIELGLGEDLQGYVSPDVTAWLGMVWAPGRGPRSTP